MTAIINPEAAARRMHENLDGLARNEYPGRGLFQGISSNGRFAIQGYWLGGRSVGSRARIPVVEPDMEEPDATKLRIDGYKVEEGTDMSYRLYDAMQQIGDQHVVTNGDHTGVIVDFLRRGHSIEEALATQEYEHDAEDTPRISGILDLSEPQPSSTLSIVRRTAGTDQSEHRHYRIGRQSLQPGVGHVIHTYEGNGPSPLPSFRRFPYAVPLQGNPDAILDRYWSVLHKSTRVALAVKAIDLGSGQISYRTAGIHDTEINAEEKE